MFSRGLKTILLVTLIFSLGANAFAQRRRSPRFEDHPAPKIFRGRSAPLRLTSEGARMYRTRLSEAAKEKPNFAGHYILTYWGCGTECIFPAIINAKTGQVYFFGFSISWNPLKFNGDPLPFQLNSKLIIVTGSLEGPEATDSEGIFYYKWENNRLKLLRRIKRDV